MQVLDKDELIAILACRNIAVKYHMLYSLRQLEDPLLEACCCLWGTFATIFLMPHKADRILAGKVKNCKVVGRQFAQLLCMADLKTWSD